jgi:hypothetical protein
MKIYVSCSSKRSDLANEVMQKLEEVGHNVTLDWTVDVPNEDGMGSEELADRADKAIDAVMDANVLILLMTDEEQSVGAMIEVGAALGNRIPVLVAELEKGFDHFFGFHPLVWRAHSIAGIMRQILMLNGAMK